MKQTVLFVVTNGIGLGHLTRGLAVAKRLRTLCKDMEPIFLTTSLGAEAIRKEGFMYFYMPTKSLLPEEVSMGEWMSYLRRQLEEIVQFYHPAALVYDGAMPYSGMISELYEHSDIKKIWIKRESYKEGWKKLNIYEASFDLVIVPREAGNENNQLEEADEKRKYCNPITLLDTEEAHSRESVRQALGVKEKDKVYYVQLGAGIINETDIVLKTIQRELLTRSGTKILLGESMIGRPIRPIDSRIYILKDYPNAQYFKAVDFAISAAGYNTFHELVQFAIPTLFIPNEQTVVDSQVRRVMNLENKKAALRLENLLQLTDKLNELEKKQKQLIRHLKKEQLPNGAMEAAQMIRNELV